MFDTQWAEVELAEPGAARPLEVVVIHTTDPATEEALRHAQSLAFGLHTSVRLLSAEVVPYPLPLHAPPVHVPFIQGRLSHLVADSVIDTHVDVRLGRDHWQTLLRALPGNPVIVVAGRRRWWWPSPEKRLARRLCNFGYHAVFVSLP